MSKTTSNDTMHLTTLMQQGLSGDKRAYTLLLEETARILRPYIARRLSHKNEIEDVVQEILISIHKARHTYDGDRPYAPWMYAIAHFRLKDYLRAQYADQLRYAADLSEAENISSQDVTESPFNYESIKGEIYQLSGRQPIILHLIHREGYTAREVAQKIGMTESAVKVTAHRAYKVLRKKLANNG